MDFDQQIDARSMLCPLPVLKARKRLKSMQAGEVLKLIADDPAAMIDVPHFCAEQGHALVNVEQPDKSLRVYYIRVSAAK